MAYAAVISLRQTLYRLLHSSQNSFDAVSTPQIFESAYNHATLLQQILIRLNDCSSGNLNAVEEQIRDEVQKLEDLLEFHEANHFLAKSEQKKTNKRKRGSAESCHYSEEIKQGITSFCETAEKITNYCVAEIGHLSYEEEEEEDDDDDDDEAAPSDLIIVADPFDYTEIKYYLLRRRRPDDFGVFQITGQPGSGVTLASATIFEDLKHCFDCRARVTVGPKYECREILLSILAQINEPGGLLNEEGDERIGELLYANLKDRRYLIVLDDLRGAEIWNFMENFFPVQDNGSAVLLTTWLNRLHIIRNSFMNYVMDSRDQDCCWYFFQMGMFGIDSEPCPPEFEEAGKKIVGNCRSLSIPLVKVILLLLKTGKNIEYWKELAEDKENPIFMVDDELLEICKITEEVDGDSSLVEGKKVMLLDLIDFSHKFKQIKMVIFPERFFPRMLTISFVGMAGIGKTSLVKKMFRDPSIRGHFDHHVWVDLGPEYECEEILVDVLAQIYPCIDKKQIKGDEDLCKSLCKQLLDKKCLIVLDDAWTKKTLDYMKKLFPGIKGATLVTTRLAKLAQLGKDDIVCKMRLLNKEESWDLFCEHIFGVEMRCPLKLERVGKKIVENCEGLPLMIVTVAGIVSNLERTTECWINVAQKNSRVFMAAYARISEVLISSYDHLPQYLKMCFLYMGVFPQNKVIPTSKLIKFWIAEGFLEPNICQRVEDFAAECLLELDSRSLVMVSQKSSSFKIKTCSLHSVFWHLSNTVAIKNKFFHAISTFADSEVNNMKGQRRLCIRNGSLLGIKDVHDSIASISAMRSLLCTAPSHQYPVPVCFGLRLLRLMDALAIRLYDFPIEVVKSYCLRYLALTYNGNLPSSMSKLWNLQFLIVGRHLSIKSPTESSYLPMEIWDMEELKHLQIAGSNLPDPKHGVILPNLLALAGVSAHSCTKKVLKGVPNLKKLAIQIELEPDEKGNPFRCLNRVSRLRGLETLKCVVVNPDFMSEIVSPPAPRSMFPLGLKKLSLSGLGYPWEYMKIISKLVNLEVLKLRCYAFQGPEWKIDDRDFEALQYLLVEDTDLVRWKFTTASFICLKSLCIKHCYQLEELPRDLSSSVVTIEVVDCNPFVESWAKEFEEADVSNFSSWDARNVER